MADGKEEKKPETTGEEPPSDFKNETTPKTDAEGDPKTETNAKKRAADGEAESRPKREKRSRKSSETFVPEDFTEVDRTTHVIQGRGTKLGNLPAVRESIEAVPMTADIVDAAHKLLFKRVHKPPKKEMRSSILQFSGYLEPKNPKLNADQQQEYDNEAEEQMGIKAHKLKVAQIKELCDFFAVDRSGRHDKDSLVDCLLDFLGEPTLERVKSGGKSIAKKAKEAPTKKKKKETTPKKKKVAKTGDESDETESEDETADEVKESPTKALMSPKKGITPTDALLRRWVHAFVQCYDMEKATVKVALKIAGEKFGVDLSDQKTRMKELLTEEL